MQQNNKKGSLGCLGFMAFCAIGTVIFAVTHSSDEKAPAAPAQLAPAACKAVEKELAAEFAVLAIDLSFGECHAVPQGGAAYSISLAVHVPDNHTAGVLREDFQYHAFAKRNPDTGEMEAADLASWTHN